MLLLQGASNLLTTQGFRMTTETEGGKAPSVRVIGRVRAAMSDTPYVLVDGSDECQYMVNRKVAGQLWGKMKVGDLVELSVAPGGLSRVLAVKLATD
jgi:hypothetical protein